MACASIIVTPAPHKVGCVYSHNVGISTLGAPGHRGHRLLDSMPRVLRLVLIGLIGLLMAACGGLWGILRGLTKSTDHPSIRYVYGLDIDVLQD